MQKGSNRLRRVEEQVKRELALLFSYSVKDPRVKMVTVHGVEIAPDLGSAKVYFTSFDEQANYRAIEKTLNTLNGFLRSELGKSLHLRTIPEFRFCYDDSVERGAKLSSLIDQVIAEDKDKSQEKSAKLDPDLKE